MKPYQPFGGRQGGGGAPNRTESGKVAAGFRADPELRFPRHASKANVEPVLVSLALFHHFKVYIQENTDKSMKFGCGCEYQKCPSDDDVPIYKRFEMLLG